MPRLSTGQPGLSAVDARAQERLWLRGASYSAPRPRAEQAHAVVPHLPIPSGPGHSLRNSNAGGLPRRRKRQHRDGKPSPSTGSSRWAGGLVLRARAAHGNDGDGPWARSDEGGAGSLSGRSSPPVGDNPGRRPGSAAPPFRLSEAPPHDVDSSQPRPPKLAVQDWAVDERKGPQAAARSKASGFRRPATPPSPRRRRSRDSGAGVRHKARSRDGRSEFDCWHAMQGGRRVGSGRSCDRHGTLSPDMGRTGRLPSRAGTGTGFYVGPWGRQLCEADAPV
ncbi:hypothetical protein CDD83_4756 [Cordyceps sp. RAO-2017]|nr:hypothetical protein CDD83_4756 [Cordyceps sp. RAO-2017]